MNPDPYTLNQPALQDLFDAAIHPQLAVQEWRFFGEVVTVDPWHWVLKKGVVQRPFDSSHHTPEQRRDAIKFALSPLQGDFVVEQGVMDIRTVWLESTLPSLHEHQLDLRPHTSRSIQARCVPTDETTGHTDIVVYLDRATCQIASNAFSNSAQGQPESRRASSPQSSVTAQQADFVEGAFVEQRLALLWQASGEDKDHFLAMIAAHPLTARDFGPDSSEIIDLIEPIPF